MRLKSLGCTGLFRYRKYCVPRAKRIISLPLQNLKTDVISPGVSLLDESYKEGKGKGGERKVKRLVKVTGVA